MTTYKLTHENYVIKNGIVTIPTVDTPEFPNKNPDYLDYLVWLAAGNVPLPADPLPVVVPEAISRAQGKAALIHAGLWDAVKSFAEDIGDDTQRALADVALNDTQQWHRASPFLNAAAASMGLTDEQLDALFVSAAGIEL